jgi:hypothetical protein
MTAAWPKISMLVSSLNMLTASKILQLPVTYRPLLPSPQTAGATAVVTADATRLPLKTRQP